MSTLPSAAVPDPNWISALLLSAFVLCAWHNLVSFAPSRATHEH